MTQSEIIEMAFWGVVTFVSICVLVLFTVYSFNDLFPDDKEYIGWKRRELAELESELENN